MKEVRILLIHAPKNIKDKYVPSANAPIPLGLLYIASTAEKAGYKVDFIDGYIRGYAAVIDKMKEFQPQVVGITCLTEGRKIVLKVASDIKQISKETLVVLGGVHPTVMGEQILEHYPFVDYIVRGAGEIAFVELLDAIFKENKRVEDVKGIGYRDNNQIVLTPYREPVDLDSLPFPKWDLINFDEYHKYDRSKFDLDAVINGVNIKQSAKASIIFSRGCGGSCNFCSTWWIWQGWHRRSPKNFVDEIEYLYKEKDIRHFVIQDDNFINDSEKVDEICDEILRRNLKIAFKVTARVDRVNESLLKKLKQAGCYMIYYGIESGSEKLLKAMNKKATLEDSYRAIKLAKEAGILVTALMIIGNVGETFQTINETIDFLKKADPDIIGAEGILWMLPGTALYNSCKAKGMIDDSFWLGNKPYFAYTFEHSKLELKIFENAVKLRKPLSPHKTVNFFTHYLSFFLHNKIQGAKQRMNRLFKKLFIKRPKHGKN